MKNKIKNIFITFLIVLLSLIISWIIILYMLSVQTDIQYCEDIARSIYHLKLENFKYGGIQEVETVIYFSFYSKKNRNESYDADIRDIITVKNFLNDYLNDNPENPLNSDKICVQFNKYPGEYVNMSNYNYSTENNTTDDFLFFQHLYTDNLSALKNLENAYIIDLEHVENIDEIDFLKNWKDLSYLYICAPTITEEQKLHLKESLPNCEIIICNNRERTHYLPETTSSTTPLS